MSKFHTLLELAGNGNEDAQMILLDIYAPLIHSLSFVDGRMDQDLEQHLILAFLVVIRKRNFD